MKKTIIITLFAVFLCPMSMHAMHDTSSESVASAIRQASSLRTFRHSRLELRLLEMCTGASNLSYMGGGLTFGHYNGGRWLFTVNATGVYPVFNLYGFRGEATIGYVTYGKKAFTTSIFGQASGQSKSRIVRLWSFDVGIKQFLLKSDYDDYGDTRTARTVRDSILQAGIRYHISGENLMMMFVELDIHCYLLAGSVNRTETTQEFDFWTDEKIGNPTTTSINELKYGFEISVKYSTFELTMGSFNGFYFKYGIIIPLRFWTKLK